MQGRIAIVTGSASGIGQATAEEFAKVHLASEEADYVSGQTFTKETFKSFSRTFTLPAALPAGDYHIMLEINDEANGWSWIAVG